MENMSSRQVKLICQKSTKSINSRLLIRNWAINPFINDGGVCVCLRQNTRCRTEVVVVKNNHNYNYNIIIKR